MTITINPVTKAKLIKGGDGTGKNDSLIEKINELYEDRATDEEIIVFTSTPDAAMAFTSLLFDKFGYKGTDITVTTPRQYALECLSTEKAFEVTGRDARLVLPYEMGFLMEDMKTSGLRPKRLREMLKFFYRCWTEFEDEDPDWLFGEEEHMVYNLLMEVLSSTRCILEAELTAMTVRYLLKEEEELKKVQYKHVLVDDYEQLSRASQYFVQILATDTITVAADVDAAVQVYESYPYLDGVEEFCKLQPEAEVAELDVCHDSPEIVEALNYYKENMVPESKDLLVDEDMWDEDEEEDFDRSLEGIEEISSENPEEEFETLAKSIQAAIKKGCAPEEIYVLTFHPYWTHMMEKSLSKLSIPSASPTDTRIASGDYRDYKKCRTQLILTALALCANEKDPLAWRCWCGYGDYLGNSVVFTSLRSYAIGTEMDIAQALESLSQMDPQGAQVLIPGIQKLLKPYAEGKRIVKGSKGLSGSSLLSYINKSVNSLIGEENLEGDSGLPHIVKTLSIPSGDTTN
ncbi:MAG: AAA family ATPase [Eggerthellaceae bacterium]|nr:AAA family ATPase [Eggerthellaceae bacterium]